MKNLFVSYALMMLLLGIFSTGIVWGENAQENGKSNPVVNLGYVGKWPELSLEDSNLPQITKAQLISEIEKSIKAEQAFKSWETKYKLTFHQFSRQERNNNVPEVVISSNIRLVSDGNKWSYEEQNEQKVNDQNSVEQTFTVSNGQKIFWIWMDKKEGQVGTDNMRIPSGLSTFCDFMPALSREQEFKGTDFPAILDILSDPDTKLLSQRTHINGQTCYVLELKTSLQHPLLKNEQELDEWKAANPEMAGKWDKAKKLTGIVINTKREVELTQRMAIAPNLGFAIVRWAYGYEMNNGYIHYSIFPDKEMNYSDFHQNKKDLYIPYYMTYTTYSTSGQSEEKLNKFQETQINLQKIEFGRQYSPEVFDINFPEGYKVMDMDKNITYTAGGSPETIDALTQAAKLRDEFYNNLKLKEAPALEYSKWINSKPMSLDDCKGKTVVLHFWSYSCSPCLYELPRLQEQYGQQARYPSSEIFISIHPYVDGDELDKLNETIKKYGITFPVMIDSKDPENLSWGKTFKKYMVFGIPAEVRIGKDGHFEKIDNEIVGTESQWLKKSED